MTGSFAALVLIAAGAVFGLSFSTGYCNTLGLLLDKTQLIVDAVTERTRRQLDPAQRQVEFLAGLLQQTSLSPAIAKEA